jgi:hypothetical protein
VISPRARRQFCPSICSLVFVLVAVFFLSAWGAHGQLHAAQKQAKPQKPYALIIGTVWGPDDRPVYGVKVKIRRARDKKAKWEIYSDHNGEFAQRVPAGESDYVLWADLKDFKPADGKTLHLAKEVNLHVYNDERVDTGLHLTQ